PVDYYYPYFGPDCNTPEEKFFEKVRPPGIGGRYQLLTAIKYIPTPNNISRAMISSHTITRRALLVRGLSLGVIVSPFPPVSSDVVYNGPQEYYHHAHYKKNYLCRCSIHCYKIP